MSKKPRVVIAGINGRFGRASARMILEGNEFELVGAFGKAGSPYVNKDIGELTALLNTGMLVSDSFKTLPQTAKPDVLLIFTEADHSIAVAKEAIEAGVKPVIGTSGLRDKDIKELKDLADKKGVGALVVPNFSVGAVLMMEFAKQAGAFFPNVEIVEMHHTKKLDAPSGTAMHTIKKLGENGKEFNKKEIDEHELVKGSRGGAGESGVRVHSLRLPGLISHQEVIFGAMGELLTIRHDGLTTECYLGGIKIALQAVADLNRLEIGLEKVMGIGANQADKTMLTANRG